MGITIKWTKHKVKNNEGSLIGLKVACWYVMDFVNTTNDQLADDVHMQVSEVRCIEEYGVTGYTIYWYLCAKHKKPFFLEFR